MGGVETDDTILLLECFSRMVETTKGKTGKADVIYFIEGDWSPLGALLRDL